MLDALAARALDARPVWWIHGARCGSEHPFRDEVARPSGPPARRAARTSRYSRPDPWDEPRPDRPPDRRDRPRARRPARRRLPPLRHARLRRGPDRRPARGGRAAPITSESFGGAPAAPPRPRRRDAASGRRRPARSPSPARTSARRGTRASRACSTSPRPTRSRTTPSCRVGSCHGCRATVLSGEVHHDPEPLDPPRPAARCCAARARRATSSSTPRRRRGRRRGRPGRRR